MKKETNAERVILNSVMGKYYHPKGDRLRIEPSGNITDRGTPIGYIIEDCVDDMWLKYLVLPYDDFRSDKSWKKHKLQLARAANNFGIRVVFVDEWDIGFNDGTAFTWTKPIFSNEELLERLIKVAKYSQDKDIKTAACCTTTDSRTPEHCEDSIIAYTYNQLLNEDSFIHAEKVLVDYVKLLKQTGISVKSKRWISLYEPCANCVKTMIDEDASCIVFGIEHKKKWDTEEYIELTNKLSMKAMRDTKNMVVYYYMWKNRKVYKFYKKEVR